MKNRYISVLINGKRRFMHDLIVEETLGRKLKGGEQVHHFNEIKSDNTRTNLVVCPSYAYHALLHQRTRALKVCGNANWRLCQYCKQYDDPANLVRASGGSSYHPNCVAAYQKARWRKGNPSAPERPPRKKFTLFGRTQSVTDWAKEYGLTSSAVHNRMYRGASLQEALLMPTKPGAANGP